MLGPSSYEGPSYILPTLPPGGAGYVTSSGFSGVAQVLSSPLSCHPFSRLYLPLWRLPLPPPLLILGSGPGVAPPLRLG